MSVDGDQVIVVEVAVVLDETRSVGTDGAVVSDDGGVLTVTKRADDVVVLPLVSVAFARIVLNPLATDDESH
jgi:hypothetical protein